MTCENEKIDGAEPCDASAEYSYTWPGKARSQLCAYHMVKLSKSADAALLGVTPIGNAPPFEAARASDVERPLVRAERPATPARTSSAPKPYVPTDLDELDRPVRR